MKNRKRRNLILVGALILGFGVLNIIQENKVYARSSTAEEFSIEYVLNYLTSFFNDTSETTPEGELPIFNFPDDFNAPTPPDTCPPPPQPCKSPYVSPTPEMTPTPFEPPSQCPFPNCPHTE